MLLIIIISILIDKEKFLKTKNVNFCSQKYKFFTYLSRNKSQRFFDKNILNFSFYSFKKIFYNNVVLDTFYSTVNHWTTCSLMTGQKNKSK